MRHPCKTFFTESELKHPLKRYLRPYPQLTDLPLVGCGNFVRLVNALPARKEIPFTILDHRTGKVGLVGVNLR